MIIKLNTPSKQSWRFFEGADEVQASTIPVKDYWQAMTAGSSASPDVRHISFVSPYYEGTDVDPDHPITVISFTHNGVPTEIFTTEVCYLLNNQGSTIERLN